MHQQQNILGESYEVVIGIGLLKYRAKEGAEILRHIIIAGVQIDFEPDKGIITLKESYQGPDLRFDTDMLNPSEEPALDIQGKLKDELSKIPGNIFNLCYMGSILRSWVNAMDPNAIYSDSIEPSKEPFSNRPELNFAPAIILRKRTRTGQAHYISKIAKQIRECKKIFPTIEDFVSIVDTAKSGFASATEKIDTTLESKKEGHKTDTDDSFSSEIYFPLAFNEEQLKIVREAAHKKGILVQGPPGTGKSQTIANLICHSIASGKRVLVTAQTSRALKVLKDKIPVEVRPLCVSLLGAGKDEFDTLTGAVNEITKISRKANL